MPKYKNEFLIAQIVVPLAAAMKHVAALDCGAWPAQNQENGKFTLGSLLDYKINIKGFEEVGVTKAIIRFDIELYDCTLEDGNYKWDGKAKNFWGGACEHNLYFEDNEGKEVPLWGEDGFLSSNFNRFDDVDATEIIVKSAFAQLSTEEQEVLFRNALLVYNTPEKAQTCP